MKNLVLLITLVTASFSYAQVNLDSSLVGLFQFNGNADDGSTLSLDGTVLNAVLTQGIDNSANSAYHFNGTNAVIECTANNRGIVDTLAVSAWFRTTSSGNNWIVGKYDWTIDKGYILNVDNDGIVYFNGRNLGGTFASTSSTNTFNDGNWHNAIGVVKGNYWELWIDCNLVDATVSTSSTPNLSNSEVLTIGKYYMATDGDHFFDGDIDEVRLYNRDLTSDEKTVLCDINHLVVNEIDQNLSLNVYPSLSNGLINIEIDLKEQFLIEIFLTDILGNKVSTIASEQITKGENRITWEFGDQPNGVYFVHVNGEKGRAVKKIVLNR